MSDILVLKTYDTKGIPKDGLSNVFNYVKGLGRIVEDTKHTYGNIVFVAGMPYSFDNKVSKNNINVIYTTFESSRLPERWVYSINTNFDYVIVPHESVKRVFLFSGVLKPIFVVQQGFVRLQRGNFGFDSQKVKDFTVGFCGVPEFRKNLYKLYLACKQLQAKEIPNLKLKIHSTSNGLDIWQQLEMVDNPMVDWRIEKFNNYQLSDWYNSLSCYVYPSSGEGWSYTPRESLYLGIPTVISDIPLHKDLINSQCCVPIKNSGLEQAMYGKKHYGNWYKIEVEEIKQSILSVYKNYLFHHERAVMGAHWIEDKFKTEDSIKEIKHILTYLNNHEEQSIDIIA